MYLRNSTTKVKVEQRMHLHCRLGGAKQRPRKERQAQIDGRRIQRVRRVLQFDAKTGANSILGRVALTSCHVLRRLQYFLRCKTGVV